MMSTQLSQIAKKAKLDRTVRFTSLAHFLTPEFLTETWGMMNRRAASGIDGESTEQFESELKQRVEEICAQLRAGAYRAPAVRRVEIPKGPGKTGTRPLGIPTVADRLLQRAGARLIEADILSYFTRISHQWLRKMVAHRIADPAILKLIGKWLKAGAMVDGALISTEEGTPQGGPISPVLSNIYLHFTLDLWFEKRFKAQCQGEAYLVRFADDFVGSFQFWGDAQNFQRQLRERFAQFNLELAEEKTRLLLFGRFAAVERRKHGQRPETFEFLGFKHVCGEDRAGRFALIRIPCTKSCRKSSLAPASGCLDTDIGRD